jgi:hypothetical protein
MSWAPQPLIHDEPPPAREAKITKDTLSPEEYTAFYVRKTLAHIAKYFHVVPPEDGPQNVAPPANAQDLNPQKFLVHNTYPMLFTALGQDMEPIFEW